MLFTFLSDKTVEAMPLFRTLGWEKLMVKYVFKSYKQIEMQSARLKGNINTNHGQSNSSAFSSVNRGSKTLIIYFTG